MRTRSWMILLTTAVSCAGAELAPVQGSTVARFTDGVASTCPDGGQVLNYGVDKNNNGVLDASEVLGSVDICNGASGTLSRVASVPAGSTCAHGGAVLTSGPDTNHNGVLDDSEVTSTTPLCSAFGELTSVVGDVAVYNADDVQRLINVETISGSLQIFYQGMGPTISFPSLTQLGGNLSGGQVGGDFFILCNKPNLGCYTQLLNTVDMPALTHVGGTIDLEYAPLGLSAPLLQTVDGSMQCNDANHTFAALASVGAALTCGNIDGETALQSVGDFEAWDGNHTYPMTSIGADPNGAWLFADDAGLSLDTWQLGTTSFPNLLASNGLAIDSVANPNVPVSLPVLGKVAWLDVQIDDGYAPNVDAPNLTHVTGGVRLLNPTPAYEQMVSALTQIDGALSIFDSVSRSFANPNVTHLASLAIASDAYQTVSLPAVTQLAANANIDAYRGSSCNWNDPNCAMLAISSNNCLHAVDLGGLTSVDGFVAVTNNASLTDLSFLAGIAQVNGILEETQTYNSVDYTRISVLILGDPITQLAFTQLTTVGRLFVRDNSALTDITGVHLTPGTDLNNCPVVVGSPQLPFCQVHALVTGYNASCPVGTPSSWNLLDPCANNPCSGQTPTCAVDCSQNSGYSCH